MAIYKVRKRNWAIISFDRSKIDDAIRRAIESIGWTDYSKSWRMTDKVIDAVIEKVGAEIPDVEANSRCSWRSPYQRRARYSCKSIYFVRQKELNQEKQDKLL